MAMQREKSPSEANESPDYDVYNPRKIYSKSVCAEGWQPATSLSFCSGNTALYQVKGASLRTVALMLA